jgi:hypothetical protein
MVVVNGTLDRNSFVSIRFRVVDIAAFATSITVEDLEADPYPIYATLREHAPVCCIPAVGLRFVTRLKVEFRAPRHVHARFS